MNNESLYELLDGLLEKASKEQVKNSLIKESEIYELKNWTNISLLFRKGDSYEFKTI